MEWEYTTHSIRIGDGFAQSGEFNAKSLTDILNWYGQQHWELVSTFPTAVHGGGTCYIGMIFKRIRQPAAAPQAT